MELINQNSSYTHSLGPDSLETYYEMEIYAQEVYWRGVLGSEGDRAVQKKKLNYIVQSQL